MSSNLPKKNALAHSVVVALLQLGVFSFEGDFNSKVQISVVLLIWLHLEGPIDFFTLLTSNVIVEVKDSLFPVSVRGFWRGTEIKPFVALGKVYIEVCD